MLAFLSLADKDLESGRALSVSGDTERRGECEVDALEEFEILVIKALSSWTFLE